MSWFVGSLIKALLDLSFQLERAFVVSVQHYSGCLRQLATFSPPAVILNYTRKVYSSL